MHPRPRAVPGAAGATVVRNLGFCELTSARRISFEESLEFEKVHEQSYRTFGYELIDIPAADLAHRVAAVTAEIARPGP